jgi:hypothetical protein
VGFESVIAEDNFSITFNFTKPTKDLKFDCFDEDKLVNCEVKTTKMIEFVE